MRGRYSRCVNDFGADYGWVPGLIQPAEAVLAHAAELRSVRRTGVSRSIFQLR